MDPSVTPKEPPKLVRGLFQGPPLPSTRYPPNSPSKQVLKIGDKEITFLINPLALEGELPKPAQGVAPSVPQPRVGIGRGAGVAGKPELPFSRLERMQNSSHSIVTQEAVESSDWLRESGGESRPTNTRNENDWLNEKEAMNDSDFTPSFQPDDIVVKGTTEPDPPVLYIMRGCPGSGKSTLATELKGRNGRVFSTDDFFLQSDGEYVFDPKKVAAYHKRNQERAREAIAEGVSPVVIDNTNTTYWEMRPYVETGLRHGYSIEFVEPNTPWRYDTCELSRRNSHGVNEETIKRMLKRFQKNPTVESVVGKAALRKILEENGSKVGESDPDIEEDPLNSSTDSVCSSPLRDKSSVFPPAPVSSPEEERAEEPDRYSILLDPETSDNSPVETQVFTPTIEPEEPLPPIQADTKPPIAPPLARTGAIVSNQEKFNQQLVEELTNSSRGNSLFCLNLQSLSVLQEILNIDKTLVHQNNFPLAQLLLPSHVISQLSHTQIANFQHNYQKYLQHMMQTRAKLHSATDTVANVQSSPKKQPLYSQAAMHTQLPPVFSHQRMNIGLPVSSNFRTEPTPFVSLPAASKLSQSEARIRTPHFIQSGAHVSDNHTELLPSNRETFQHSEMRFEANKQTNKQITLAAAFDSRKPEMIPNDTAPFQDTSAVAIDTVFSDSSYTSEANETPEDSATLSPSEHSLSTSGTLENTSESIPASKSSVTATESIVNGEAVIEPVSNNTTEESLKFSDNQNDLIPDLPEYSDGNSAVPESVPSEQTVVENISTIDSRVTTNSVQMDRDKLSYCPGNEVPFLSTHLIPLAHTPEPDTLKRILSEKIDWGDSAGSGKSSPQVPSPDVPDTAVFKEETVLPTPLSIGPVQWDTWTGWGANFMTQAKSVSRPLPSEQVKKPSFDPTIQPPRKHSTSSVKSGPAIPEFTPSFSRFKSMDADSNLSSRRFSSSLEDNPRAVLIPGGAEWEWSKFSTPVFPRKNGNSEASSPRSDPDDPRNSKLNPFAVPWKPVASLKPKKQLEDPEKLNHLRGFFPTLPPTELQIFLNEYDNDVDKALEAIIDQAEALNLDIPMSSQVALPNRLLKKVRSPKKSEKVTTPLDATAPEFLLDESVDKKWQQHNFETAKTPTTTTTPTPQATTASTTTTPIMAATTTNSWTDSAIYKPASTYNFKQMIGSSSLDAPTQSDHSFPDNADSTPLVLDLDSNLTKELVKQFGPIPGYSKEASLDPSCSRIVLCNETAQLVYQMWCKSVQAMDQYYVPPGQGGVWVPPENPAQQAKLQLYSLYPGIDTHDLDQVLSAKNYSLSAAHEYIRTALSSAQVQKDPLTPSFALVTQRGSQSFPPLSTKTPRNSTPIFSNHNLKPLF